VAHEPECSSATQLLKSLAERVCSGKLLLIPQVNAMGRVPLLAPCTLVEQIRREYEQGAGTIRA